MRPIHENETWLTPAQVVRRYPVGNSTLAKWRSEGKGGPVYSRINGGHKILYRAADIEEFFARHRVPQAPE